MAQENDRRVRLVLSCSLLSVPAIYPPGGLPPRDAKGISDFRLIQLESDMSQNPNWTQLEEEDLQVYICQGFPDIGSKYHKPTPRTFWKWSIKRLQ